MVDRNKWKVYSAKKLYDELHANIDRKSVYNTWIRRNIKRFNLIENDDYWIDKKESTGGRPLVDLLLREDVYFLIKQRQIISSVISLENRKETVFLDRILNILDKTKAFKGLYENYVFQYPVLSYRVDIYFPSINLIVEYDEEYHAKQKKEDERREAEIKEYLECNFIRVKENYENRGIGEIIDYFITVL